MALAWQWHLQGQIAVPLPFGNTLPQAPPLANPDRGVSRFGLVRPCLSFFVLAGLEPRKRKTSRFLNASNLNASPGTEGSLQIAKNDHNAFFEL